MSAVWRVSVEVRWGKMAGGGRSSKIGVWYYNISEAIKIAISISPSIKTTNLVNNSLFALLVISKKVFNWYLGFGERAFKSRREMSSMKVYRKYGTCVHMKLPLTDMLLTREVTANSVEIKIDGKSEYRHLLSSILRAFFALVSHRIILSSRQWRRDVT